MSLKFLSDAWFEKVSAVKAEVGDFEVPSELQGLAINVCAKDSDGDKLFCLNNGMIEKGHQASAPVTMTLPADLAFKIFVESDASAGMQGFMMGLVQIDGDPSRVMALQMVQPTEAMKQMQKKIIDATSL